LILFILCGRKAADIPLGQKKHGETKKGQITVVWNDLPGIAAHTAAEGPKRAQDFVISTGLELRKRIPLARFARSCAAPPLKKNRSAKLSR